MLNTFIIYSEKRFANVFGRFLENNFPEIIIMGSSSVIAESAVFIDKLKPELVFMEINAANISYFELFGFFTGKRNFEVIIIAPDFDYVHEAFANGVFDYFAGKPGAGKLKSSLERLKNKRSLKQPAGENSALLNTNISVYLTGKIIIPVSGGFQMRSPQDIVRIDAEGNYSNIFLINGEIIRTCSYSLCEFEKILPAEVFLKIHKSHIVNRCHITSLTNKDSGTLTMTGNIEVKVASRCYKPLAEYLVAGGNEPFRY